MIEVLSNVKKIVNKTNKTSPNTVLAISIIISKRQKEFREARGDTNSRLKKICRQEKINLISKLI